MMELKSPNLNYVILAGRTVADPTVITDKVVKVRLAINRNYHSGDEWKTETVFITVTGLGRFAERLKELGKGTPILVEGRLSSREWTDELGKKRTQIEVIVNSLQVLTTKRDVPVPEFEVEDEKEINPEDLPF